MGKDSAISWTNHTFNCWWGCTKVGNSPACDGCYAETWAERCGFSEPKDEEDAVKKAAANKFLIWGDDAKRRYFGDQHWDEPLKWNRDAEKAGKHARVFCMSMGDWAEGRPEQAPQLERLWVLIEATPWLDWMMLTKRPQLISKLCPVRNDPRVWQGVTAENQYWLNLRWKLLRQVESLVYWLSVEPLMEHIVLPDDFLALGKRALVIVGGESGSHARPMHPNWARALRDQCVAAGVAFHFKQWGEFLPALQDGNGVLNASDGLIRIGKKKAGRLLDGRTWDQMPEVSAAL